MTEGQALRQMRVAAGVSGGALCARIGIHRSRLSDIERGYVRPSADEVKRLRDALQALVAAREKVAAVAAEVGYPL